MKAAKESETNIPKLITGNGIRNSNPDWQPLP